MGSYARVGFLERVICCHSQRFGWKEVLIPPIKYVSYFPRWLEHGTVDAIYLKVFEHPRQRCHVAHGKHDRALPLSIGRICCHVILPNHRKYVIAIG